MNVTRANFIFLSVLTTGTAFPSLTDRRGIILDVAVNQTINIRSQFYYFITPQTGNAIQSYNVNTFKMSEIMHAASLAFSELRFRVKCLKKTEQCRIPHKMPQKKCYRTRIKEHRGIKSHAGSAAKGLTCDKSEWLLWSFNSDLYG